MLPAFTHPAVRWLLLVALLSCESDFTEPSEVALATPESPAAAVTAVAKVVLLPGNAASRLGAATQFTATARNSAGQAVSTPVSYRASCGAVNAAGIYTAPATGSGTCRVIASAGGKADTTRVTLLTAGKGIPFGLSELWTSPTVTVPVGVAMYRASHDNTFPDEILAHISAARSQGIGLVLNMTGGAHDRYKTDGVFDEAKWQAAMDAYDTPAIRSAVGQAVADGTILGNSVMDEPQQYRGDKSWGPKGTLTRARIDGLCRYVKNIFPTMPVGVFHDPYIFQPDSSYRICDFLIAQYGTRKGDVVQWREAALDLVRRDRMAIMFSLNLLDGGKQDKDGAYDCAGTGGLGTYEPNCRMTPAQVRTYGEALGRAGCALMSWRYDAAFMSKAENKAALSTVATTLFRLARAECRRY